MPRILGDLQVNGVSTITRRNNEGFTALTMDADVIVDGRVTKNNLYGNPANYTVQLPDASTLPLGWEFMYALSEASNPTVLLDGVGNPLIEHLPGERAKFILVDNSTPQGIWKALTSDPKLKKDRLSGLLYPIGNDEVELSPDGMSLSISPRILLFNYGYQSQGPEADITALYFNGGMYPVPPTGSGLTELTYIIINDAGAVLFDNTPVTLANRDRVLLARGIREFNGTNWVMIDFKYMPQMADSDFTDRYEAMRAVRFHFYPNVDTPSLSRLNFTDFALMKEGINYGINPLDPNKFAVPASTPGTWWNYWPDNLQTTYTQELDGSSYYDPGTQMLQPVPAGQYTIQVLLVDPLGEVIRIYGQELFTTLTNAMNSALGSQWNTSSLPSDCAAVGAFIINGSQYSGSPDLDLTNINNYLQCGVPQQLQSEVSSGGGSAPSVSGNTILQDGVLVGLENAVKNFNFRDFLTVSVNGDTVDIVGQGVPSSTVIDTFPNTSNPNGTSSIYLSAAVPAPNLLTIVAGSSVLMTDAYTLMPDMRTVVFTSPIGQFTRIEARYVASLEVDMTVAPIPLFAQIWANNKITDLSYGLSDMQPKDGNVYTTAWQNLTSDYNSGTVSSVVVPTSPTTNISVDVTRGPNDFEFVSQSDYNNMISAIGACPYYTIDEVNTQFTLPFWGDHYQGGGTAANLGTFALSGGVNTSQANPVRGLFRSYCYYRLADIGSGLALADISALIDSKVDKIPGMGLSTNDFTTQLLQKLTDIPTPSTILTTATGLTLTTADARYVQKTGDTMTGGLNLINNQSISVYQSALGSSRTAIQGIGVRWYDGARMPQLITQNGDGVLDGDVNSTTTGKFSYMKLVGGTKVKSEFLVEADKGAVNGVAQLDPNSVVLLSQLPVEPTNITFDPTTGVISITATKNIATVTITNPAGGATIAGTASITGSTATFTPTTATDITAGSWYLLLT